MRKAPEKMGIFTLYNKEPNTIFKHGYLYTTVIHFETKNQYTERKISVYLPSNYNFSNKSLRFPVVYMFDGSNLFDDYQSFAGEWHADEAAEAMRKDGYKAPIFVGIDCPGNGDDREAEMTPYNLPLRVFAGVKPRKGYGEVLGNFLVKIVKPLIDKTFNTYTTRKNTTVGGSSMGGLMSFYCALEYSHVFSKCISFSPAFSIYRDRPLLKYISKTLDKIDNLGDIYFFNGDQELDKILKPDVFKVYDLMVKKGYDKDQVCLLFDSRSKHHESEWAKYLLDALKWLNKR